MSASSYKTCLEEIEALQGRGIHKGLSRMEAALRILGNPHHRFPAITIAGTNGKGSTAAVTAEILKKSSFKTGLTISPHVEDFRERIQINRNWIPEEAVVTFHEKMKKTVGHLPLTYFEWTILMAFLHFASSRVDIAVLETGMGGRWDATNVVVPMVAAITNVSLDHEAHLGSRLEDILAEKMQIFKTGIPAWAGVTQKNLWELLQKNSRENQIPLFRLDEYYRENPDGTFSIFNYRLQCCLLGQHQNRNAALAVALCSTLMERGYGILPGAIEAGVSEVYWPGRLETVSQKPVVLLDAAHNRGGIEALVSYLESAGRKFHLVFGTLSDRPFAEMLIPLTPYVHDITLFRFDGGERNFSELELKEQISRLPPETAAKIKNAGMNLSPEAWKAYAESVNPQEAVLVTGSLYLVSQIRALIKGIPS